MLHRALPCYPSEGGGFCCNISCYETVGLYGEEMIFVLSGTVAEKRLSLAGYKVLQKAFWRAAVRTCTHFFFCASHGVL